MKYDDPSVNTHDDKAILPPWPRPEMELLEKIELATTSVRWPAQYSAAPAQVAHPVAILFNTNDDKDKSKFEYSM